MSGLWTPSGGDPEPPERGAGTPSRRPPEPEPSPEEVAALRELHARLVATPVVDVDRQPCARDLAARPRPPRRRSRRPTSRAARPTPDLASAGLAIDALAALVDGLGTRLGEHEPVLRDALAQAQMLFVEVADATAAAT